MSSAPAGSNDDHPNVVIVYTDQHRYDALGIDGNDLIRTPALDRFGRGGVHFRNGYVNSPICQPSRVALFTGRYSHVNRSFNNSCPMSSRETDMASVFREGGYATALVGKDHCFGPRVPDVFDHVFAGDHMGVADGDPEVAERVRSSRKGTMQVPMAENPLSPEEDVTGILFTEAARYVRERAGADEPFFLWLSIPDPHPPYMVCEPYASMYEDVTLPPPAWRENEMENKPFRQQLVVEWNRFDSDYPGDAIDTVRRIYWGMVSYIDDCFGAFMETLEAVGLDDDTVVVFTADHGDYMGDHRMVRKGPHVYESLVRVPLMMRWGDRFAARSTDAFASNVDIFPTLCALCGVPCPDGVQGVDLAPVLRGESDGVRDALFFEHGNPGKPLAPGELSDEEYDELQSQTGHHLCPVIYRGRTRGVRWGDWKYVYNDGDVDELYDLAADPEELRNLADRPEHADIVREGRDRLLRWEVETEDPVSAFPER